MSTFFKKRFYSYFYLQNSVTKCLWSVSVSRDTNTDPLLVKIRYWVLYCIYCQHCNKLMNSCFLPLIKSYLFSKRFMYLTFFESSSQDMFVGLANCSTRQSQYIYKRERGTILMFHRAAYCTLIIGEKNKTTEIPHENQIV